MAAPATGAAPGTRTTVFMTPSGAVGFRPGDTAGVTAVRWSTEEFAKLADGTLVQLLPEQAGGTASFETRVQIEHKRNLTIRGLGARTIVKGATQLADMQCDRPKNGKRGCEGDLSLSASAKPQGGDGLSRQDRVALTLVDAQAESSSSLFEILNPPKPGGSAVPLALPGFGKKKNRLAEAACIDLVEVNDVTIEDVDFKGCWFTAVRADGSSGLTLRRSTITGGSYGLLARGDGPKGGRPSRRILVEQVRWIQDDSSYEGEARDGICRADAKGKAGCPGKMWRNIPWGSSHHGVYEYYNGALLGGIQVAGEIVFRNNQIENAYNGIRLTAPNCKNAMQDGVKDPPCAYNNGVWILDNSFSYIRDNPVELEHWATNVVIAGNSFHNSHAWLSFDGAGGGPVYVFGNRGWFDEKPTNGPCVATPTFKADGKLYDPAFDVAYDWAGRVWNEVGVAEANDDGSPREWMDPAEMTCRRGRIGRVIKIGFPDTVEPPQPAIFDRFPYFTKGPLYVFNNSWYSRAPVIGGGMVRNLRHWNNAVLFCAPGTPGYDPVLCAPDEPDLIEPMCLAGNRFGVRDFPGHTGTLPFFTCFRTEAIDSAGKILPGLANSFDYDVSSIGFPPDLAGTSGFERHGREADPGFIAPDRGDFTLARGASAATSPCTVTRQRDGSLACQPSPVAFAGAFAPSGKPYSGPDDKSLDVPAWAK